MIFFISVLRALAAMIITNSHYTGVYPNDIIANGGLYGDVIFFAVSGFCLLNVKGKLGGWYAKRILRCYVAPVIITIVYMLIGFYENNDGVRGFIHWFIYPTDYHFVASIVVLYLPFYFVGRIEKLKKNIPTIMGIVFVAFLIYYIFMYDKSFYHIDKVREPAIRVLFFEAMCLGGYFKVNYDKFENINKAGNWVWFVCLFVLYFASKIAFTKVESISNFQIINQIILMALLAVTLRCFCGIDNKLEKMPQALKRIIYYLADITLEIYVVQYAIIPRLKKVAIFPLNWCIITATILLSASLLHVVVKAINKQTDKLFIKD